MNNIDYKNVILGLNKNSSLPYKELGHIKYTSSTSINSGTLNNTFNQFIDNDKYTERYLNGKTSYQYGPKSDDSEKVYYGDNGYKYFKDNAGQLAIYRKIEKDLNEDIRKEIDGNANFIFKRDSYYICGLDSALKYSQDLDTWTTINLNNVKGYYSSEYLTIVAAKDGVYFVNFSSSELTVDKINETELQNCKSVCVNDSNYIYVGCSDGIYKANYGAYSKNTKIKFEKLQIRKQNGDVTKNNNVSINDIIDIDGDVYLAGEDNVYKDKREDTLIDYNLWIEDKNINCAVKVGEYTFVGTDNNLFGKYDESDKYYSLFPDTTPVYSAVAYQKVAYVGTKSGLLSVNLSDGILQPIDEYPIISELSNVTTLKMYSYKGKKKLFGINGKTSFFLDPKTGITTNILSDITQNDIHVTNNKIYVATPDGLINVDLTCSDYTLETIDSLKNTSGKTITEIDGLITAGTKTFAYGPHYIFNIAKTRNSKTITETINTVFYTNQFGTNYNSILIFTDVGVKLWSLDTNDIIPVDSENIIYDIVQYDDYFFGVAKRDNKYYICEYNNELKYIKSFSFSDEKSKVNSNTKLFIEHNYLYTFSKTDGTICRYSITDGSSYGHIEKDYPNVIGIFDNNADQLMIATKDGLYYSKINTAVTADSGNKVPMTNLNNILLTQINDIRYDRDGEIEDKQGKKQCSIYTLYTNTGVSSIYFENDENYSKCDFSKYTLSSEISEISAIKGGSIGNQRLIQISSDSFIIKDNNYSDIGSKLTTTSLYANTDANLIDLEDCAEENQEKKVDPDYKLILRTNSNNIYFQNYNQKLNQITCFTTDQVSNFKKFMLLDDQYVIFGSDAIYALYITNNGQTSTTEALNTLPLSYDQWNTAVRVNFNDNTVSPSDTRILFGLQQTVYCIELNSTNKCQYSQYISNEKVGTGNIIGISQTIFHNNYDVFIWVFFKDKAIEYRIKGSKNKIYEISPEATGREKIFDKHIKKGYVSQVLDNEELPGVEFVVLTEDDKVKTTYTSDNYYDNIILEKVEDLRQYSTFNDEYNQNDGDYTTTTMNYFYILSKDHVLYNYKENSLYLIKRYTSQPQLYYCDETNWYLETAENKSINIIKKGTDEYKVNLTNKVDYMLQHNDILLFLRDEKIYYSNCTKYYEFSEQSIRELKNGDNVDNFINSDIKKIATDGNRVLAFTENKQYSLKLEEKSKDSEIQVQQCTVTDLNIIQPNLDLQNVILYKSYITREGQEVDLYDSLKNIVRYDNILYYDKNLIYYRSNNNFYKELGSDISYHHANNIHQIRICNNKMIASDDDGIYDFSYGEIGNLIKSKNGYGLSGDIDDFVFYNDEYIFEISGAWYSKLSNGEDYEIPVTSEIKGFGVSPQDKKLLVCSDGVYEIVYTKATKVDKCEQTNYIEGTNIDKVYGSIASLKLLTINKDTKFEVYSFVPETGYFNQYSYVLNIKDPETGIITPEEFKSFENIAFLNDTSNVVIQYNGDTYIKFGGNGGLEYIPINIPNINKICKTSDLYNLCTSSGLIQFSSFGNLYYFISTYNAKSDIRYNKFIEHDGELYICSQYGIYKLSNDKPVRISQSSYNSEIGSFSYDSNSGKFLIPIRNYVYETNNIRLFKTQKFNIDNIEWIKQVFKKDAKTYFFVTNDGLYKTNYQYELSNDIEKFGVQDAINVYQSMKDEIDYYYTTQYNTHLAQYHKTGSNIDLLNNGYIDKNFDDINSDWQKDEICADYIAVQNDIVFEIESSTNEDGDIIASASNVNQTLSGLTLDDIPLTYILKRWKSGICELYIYLTTTNTYYLPFNQGIPGCNVNEEELIQRDNLNQAINVATEDRKQNSKISEHYTNIQLNILSSFCYLDCIQDIQINGNSLPLRVYKDTQQIVDSTAQNLYQSFIEPSLVESYDISETDDSGYYNLRFKCFGSDAQAIRIQFYDSKHKYGKNSYVVVFDSNGGSGTMRQQRVAIGQEVKLRKNKFTKRVSGEARVFLGWSLTKQNDNTQPAFTDESQFSAELAGTTVENGGTITLYAVWLAYNFGDGNSTQIVIESNKKEFIIKEAETFRDDKIGDQVIIDFGD